MAIREAGARLEAAKNAGAAADDRAAALQQRKVFSAFADAMRRIDEVLALVVAKSNLAVELMRSRRQYGWTPTLFAKVYADPRNRALSWYHD